VATVLKRIKGRLYWYEQRSYRHLGKVKTESKYVRPASAREQFMHGLKHPYGVTPMKLLDDRVEGRTAREGNGKPVGSEVTPPVDRHAYCHDDDRRHQARDEKGYDFLTGYIEDGDTYAHALFMNAIIDAKIDNEEKTASEEAVSEPQAVNFSVGEKSGQNL
jgi:hypothetical protein